MTAHTPTSPIFPYTPLFRSNVTQTTTLPVRLDPATVSGMVTIRAEAPLVQQETSQVGRTIEEQAIRQLPLPTRNRSEEHTSELQSLRHLVCRLLLEKKKTHQ